LFLHATFLYLVLRLVRVNRIQMWMAGPDTPADFFPDIINPFAAVDLDLVGGFGPLHRALSLLSRWNYKSVVAARPDASHILSAGDRRTEK
jgi:hypothetical protein